MKKELRLAYQEIATLRERQREMELAIRELTRVASTDELTGLPNRRRFGEELDSACAFAMRRGTPLSLVVVDVDHFKSYNDMFGHIAGDRILCIVARVLGGLAREYDVISRFGGEEFTMLLPGTDRHGAVVAAERHREALETHRWPLGTITASFGIATSSQMDFTPLRLLDLADRALYRSKREGRNRVTHFDDLRESANPEIESFVPRAAHDRGEPDR